MSAAADLIALLRQRTEPVGLREFAAETGLDASPRGLLSLSYDLRALGWRRGARRGNGRGYWWHPPYRSHHER